MELAIPLIALGGMYIASNKSDNTQKKKVTRSKENYENLGTRPNIQTNNPEKQFSNYLPNTNIPAQNYPITNNAELADTVQSYPNPNVATDKYFNQNAYEEKVRAGKNVGGNPQSIYSLSGDYMDTKEFNHNNMVPFNGGKTRGQIYNNDNAENILDNYIGSGSQVIKKVEQAPLFKPQDNVQWTHGTPNQSDFYQSRVNPVNRNNMVKPFESIQVGPGLDKGYGTDGSQGFNSGMEARDKWLPKTVDELRVTTNPKQEYSLAGHQGPAMANITNIGIEGKMEKNRPDTFFVNSQDRWLTTTGAEKAGRVVAEEVVKQSHRNETTTFQHGAPNATIKTASYTPITYEDSKKHQLGAPNAGPSSASSTAPHHEDKDNTQKSHSNYKNNRSSTKDVQTYGSGFSGAVGAVIAPFMDILKPSRKEEYGSNMRIYGNSAGQVPGNYTISKNDVPNNTIKETTLYQPNSYIGNQGNSAYLVTDHQPIANQRDTSNTSQINGSGSKYGVRSYDAEYRQTNNDTKEKLVVGRTAAGNAKMYNTNTNVTIAKNDSDRNNNRLWAPPARNATGPSVQTYGHTQSVQYTTPTNDTGGNRIDPNLLSSFKENPYTHSLQSAV